MDTPGRPQSRPSKQWRPATTGGRTRGLSDSTHIDDILGVEDERPRHAGAHHAAGVLVAPHQDPVCGGVECGFRGRGSACWCVRACLAVVQCGAGDDGPCIPPWPLPCLPLPRSTPTHQPNTPDDLHPETHPWLVPQPSFTMVPAACSRSHAPCGPVPDAASPTSDDAGGDASAAPLAVGAVAWPTGRWRAAAGPVAGSGVFGGRA